MNNEEILDVLTDKPRHRPSVYKLSEILDRAFYDNPKRWVSFQELINTGYWGNDVITSSHDTKCLEEIRKDRKTINEDLEMNKIVIWGTKGLKRATKEEGLKKYSSLVKNFSMSLKMAKELKAKIGLDGQLVLPLTKYWKEVCDVFVDEIY